MLYAWYGVGDGRAHSSVVDDGVFAKKIGVLTKKGATAHGLATATRSLASIS